MCFFEERDGEVHCYIAYILIIPDMFMCWLQIPRVALLGVQELHATAEAILFAGRAAQSDVDGSVLLEERDAAESINRDLCSSNISITWHHNKLEM